MQRIISNKYHGLRLDQVLKQIVPELSLRTGRKLIDKGLVSINGRPCAKAYKVAAGQTLAIEDEIQSGIDKDKVSILYVEKPLAAIFKPGGMHCQSGRGLSLEQSLPELLGQNWCLVNRLDYLTSGIVLAASSVSGRQLYLDCQQKGLVQKHYFVLVQGKISKEQVIENKIDSAKRKKVKVLSQLNPDFLRHTRVIPLHFWANKNQTLLRAEILKGQRHQIRAHLSYIGHAIVGDPLYGQAKGDILFLHHGYFKMDNFCVQALPDWPHDILNVLKCYF